MGRRVRCLDGQGDAVHPLPQEQRAVSREPLRLRGVFRADDDERGVRGAGRSWGFQVAARCRCWRLPFPCRGRAVRLSVIRFAGGEGDQCSSIWILTATWTCSTT